MASMRLAATLCALMVMASVVGSLAKPSVMASDRGPTIQLDSVVPRQFGVWREEPQRSVQVVNPQTQAVLDKLYSQTLTRVYVDASGYRVMLSLAYGDDQRGGLQAHKPEVCYPAQGFQLLSNRSSDLETAYGRLPVRQLDTQLGGRREPVTYWLTMADSVVRGRFEQRLVELKLGLTGQVPNGLLFRVSSIDTDVPRGHREQGRFVSDLLAALAPQDRLRVSGLQVQP
jgi:EpsI family protein